MEQYTCGERQAARQDYQQYDRIWQRVSPELDPYPEVRAAMAPAPSAGTGTAAGTVNGAAAGSAPAVPSIPAVPAVPATPVQPVTPAAPAASALPGDISDPCCMGTEAQLSLGVLQGFLEEECRQRMVYLAYARRMNDRSGLLRRLADQSLVHIKKLAAAHYLITGRCVHPLAQSPAVQPYTWCQLLRFCYHQEACDRFNYLRAADETTDPCLTELFQDLAEASGEAADELFQELSRLMCRQR